MHEATLTSLKWLKVASTIEELNSSCPNLLAQSCISLISISNSGLCDSLPLKSMFKSLSLTEMAKFFLLERSQPQF